MDDLSIEKAVSRAFRVRGAGTRMGYNLFLEENLVGSHTTESSPCGYGHPPAWARGHGLESAVPREPAGAVRPAGTILPVPFPERAIGGCGKGTCRPSGARRRRQGTPGRAQPGGDRHREDAGGGPSPNVGRLALIGCPIRGSEAVEALLSTRLGRNLIGPVAREGIVRRGPRAPARRERPAGA